MTDTPPAGFDSWRSYVIHTLEEGRRRDELDAAAARDLAAAVAIAAALVAAAAVIVGGAS